MDTLGQRISKLERELLDLKTSGKVMSDIIMYPASFTFTPSAGSGTIQITYSSEIDQPVVLFPASIDLKDGVIGSFTYAICSSSGNVQKLLYYAYNDAPEVEDSTTINFASTRPIVSIEKIS